jgi:hypothetical protein
MIYTQRVMAWVQDVPQCEALKAGKRRVIMSYLLLKDGGKYAGKYVATRTFDDSEVVSSGDDPRKVKDEASKKGVDDPVIFYVPKKGMVSIY